MTEKKKPGLAQVSVEKRKEIALMGGRASKLSPNHYTFTRADNSKGGTTSGRNHAAIPGYMAKIGRLGRISRSSKVKPAEAIVELSAIVPRASEKAD